MYLQRIELQGFKSFAGKTVLEFPAPGKGCKIAPNINIDGKQLERGLCGVTAIVGPNGSGKSNVVDAVRWVLGEQSLKLLRGKKSTDVIFSGSAKKARMGMAEVSLYLNNEDGSAPIDYSEVVITRKLYRDGNSEYLLNKNSVRLFDIVMLLAKTHFGQNTYSVIGQGMIDKIVNYSSQDRKEFFDEATGVKQFQIKREKSVNKLKRSRENIAQVRALIQESEPHLKSLTRQVTRLNKRREIEVELKDLQTKYYGKLWLELDSNYQNLAISFSQTEKEKIKLEIQISEIEQELEKLSQEKGRAQEFNELQNNYDSYISQRNGLSQQLAEVKGKLDVEYLKIGKQDLTWLENRQDDLNLKIKEIENQIEVENSTIERLEGLLSDKTSKQEKVLAEFHTLEEKLLDLQKEFQSDLGVSEKEIRQVVNRIYSLQKDFIHKLKTTHDLDALSKLKAEAEVVFGEVEVFYQKISRQEKKQQSEEMIDLQKQLSNFLTSKDSLVNEINEIKIKLEVAVSQRRSLLTKVEEFKADLVKVEGNLSKNQIDPQDKDKVSQHFKEEKEMLQKQTQEIEIKIQEIKSKIDHFNEKEEEKKKQIFSLQQEMHNHQSELNQVIASLNEIKVELAKIETKKEDLFVAMRQDLGEEYRPKLNRDFKDVDINQLEIQITKLRRQLELIGGIDLEVEKEYNELKERHDFLSGQSEDLEKAIEDLEKIVVKLDKLIKEQFETEFKKINKDFLKYFKQLFEGGTAKLILTQKETTEAEEARQEIAENIEAPIEGEEAEPVAEEVPEEKKVVHVEDKSFLVNMGIDIEACPPGKKIKNINVLSGGEKTMTALALICAIIANNPSPFILFDEVDAALDESNSSKFSGIIEELSRQTQFIVITHNRAIMARADVLYGVTMQGDGVSRLIGLKLDEAEKMSQN